MNPRFPVIVPNSLQRDIIEFALSTGNERYFVLNRTSSVRKGCIISDYPELPISEAIQTFAVSAYKSIGVDSFIPEHIFGNFIGVNLEGGFVHEHRDPRNDKNFIHTRFNFLLQKPENGGDPIINGTVYPMNEGQGWLNLASEWSHGSTEVVGKRERVVLSLGAYIHPGMIRYLTDIMEAQ
jgi:hypothetical protein